MPKNALCRKVEPIGERTIMRKTFTVYGSDQEPLLLGKDVASWIDYSKTSQGYYDVSNMMKLVDDDEKLLRNYFVAGQYREAWFVNEDGLYELLMLNKTEQGKKFKKEVKKMLKHLREDGSYIVHKKDDNWNKIRFDSKEARKAFSDILKEFIEYAKGQGSQHSDRYYGIFTRLINEKLSIPNYLNRDDFPSELLDMVNHYEYFLGRCILTQMKAQRPYKEVYQACKQLIQQI